MDPPGGLGWRKEIKADVCEPLVEFALQALTSVLDDSLIRMFCVCRLCGLVPVASNSFVQLRAGFTWRDSLMCSSFRYVPRSSGHGLFTALPKKELHSSLQVAMIPGGCSFSRTTGPSYPNRRYLP